MFDRGTCFVWYEKDNTSTRLVNEGKERDTRSGKIVSERFEHVLPFDLLAIRGDSTDLSRAGEPKGLLVIFAGP